MKGKVVGIGGVFFESDSPDELKSWYQENLGFITNQYGALFEFKKASNNQTAYLNWSPMKKPVDYFNPSKKGFMVNYRVQNIEDLMIKLKNNGVKQIGSIESFSYGKFAWVIDPEGNKIELWEPIDKEFEEDSIGKTILE